MSQSSSLFPAPHSSGTARPHPALPDASCDAHLHVLDPRFPGSGPCPPGMTLEDYRVLQARLGLRRAVFVQAKHHGTDPRCLLDALAQMNGDARGIAVLDETVSDAELLKLQDAGVRGLRFSLWNPCDAVVGLAEMERLAPRIADLGWHVQLHMTADQIHQERSRITRLNCPIVFDHMGRLPPKHGTGHPAFAFICNLLEADRAWVKLSGPYLNTEVGSPTYQDTGTVARAFLDRAPERLVWGSDWPHMTEPVNAKPDDARLCDLLFEWAGNDRRDKVLISNAEALYGFQRHNCSDPCLSRTASNPVL